MRSALKMSTGMKTPEKKNGKSNGRNGSRGTPTKLQTELLEMPAWVPQSMEPGSVFLLRNRSELRAEHGPHGFWAVIACPQCGTLGLIPETQYRSQHRVTCGSARCSSHFFSHVQSRLDSLPNEFGTAQSHSPEGGR